MSKIKDLPKGTNIIGLNVRIPSYLRSSINLLNKGYIVSYWDDSASYNGSVILPGRAIGVWLSTTSLSDKKKRSIYPCFLNTLDEINEFQIIEEKKNKPQLNIQAIRNTTNINA